FQTVRSVLESAGYGRPARFGGGTPQFRLGCTLVPKLALCPVAPPPIVPATWCVRIGHWPCPTRIMTHRTYEIVRGTIILALALSAVGWYLVRCLKRSDDPARLIFKWVLT